MDVYCEARFKEHSGIEKEYFTMRVDPKTGEVTQVGTAIYTIGSGFHDRVEKYPNEEGFEDLLRIVFQAQVEITYELTPLKKQYPSLFKTLYEKYIKY